MKWAIRPCIRYLVDHLVGLYLGLTYKWKDHSFNHSIQPFIGRFISFKLAFNWPRSSLVLDVYLILNIFLHMILSWFCGEIVQSLYSTFNWTSLGQQLVLNWPWISPFFWFFFRCVFLLHLVLYQIFSWPLVCKWYDLNSAFNLSHHLVFN